MHTQFFYHWRHLVPPSSNADVFKYYAFSVGIVWFLGEGKASWRFPPWQCCQHFHITLPAAAASPSPAPFIMKWISQTHRHRFPSRPLAINSGRPDSPSSPPYRHRSSPSVPHVHCCSYGTEDVAHIYCIIIKQYVSYSIFAGIT